MAPKPFAVKSFADYVKKLREANVILDGDERARLILDGARALAKKEKLALVEDEALLAENAGLTEWPVALMGSFDEAFLSVPPEVLATSMKAHQKCFSLRKGEQARQPIHIGGQSRSEGRRQGHRRRQRAGDRRAAGRRQVLLRPGPQDHAARPRAQAEGDHLPREARLAISTACSACACWRARLRRCVGADPDLAERAAILSKADLVSLMVGEFPELQGVMGRYYALDRRRTRTSPTPSPRITSR